jgi:hypothetical protein
MKPLMTPAWDDLGNERSQWIQLFARMKPGETVDSARGKLQNVFRQVLEEEIKMPGMRTVSAYYLDLFRKRQVKMELASTGYSGMRNQVGDALLVLMGMVGLVLLISCANVANLLIARAAARQKELAVRMAIGSSRGQLVRQLLIESLVLAFSGAALGVILSMWTVRALMSFAPAGASALTVQATPDTRVLAFTIGLAFLTSLIFGLLPAMQSTRLNLWITLKDMVGGIAGGFSGVRLRKALVAAQVAFSFLLLAGAGLFMRSLSNLQSTETGFKAMSNLVTFQVNPALNGYNGAARKALLSPTPRQRPRRARSAGRRNRPRGPSSRKRVRLMHVGGRAHGQGRRRHAGIHEQLVARLLHHDGHSSPRRARLPR